MNTFKRTLATSVMTVAVFAVSASAQEKGGPPEIVRHPTNPHNMGSAVTAGSALNRDLEVNVNFEVTI